MRIIIKAEIKKTSYNLPFKILSARKAKTCVKHLHVVSIQVCQNHDFYGQGGATFGVKTEREKRKGKIEKITINISNQHLAGKVKTRVEDFSDN